MADGSEERNKKSKSRSKSRKRPCYKNPYLNFLRDFRQLPEHQNSQGKDIFKAAGQRWRNLSTAEKEPYVTQAEFAKHEAGGEKKMRNKTRQKRTCSKCGHRHGSPIVDDSGEDTRYEDPPTSFSSRSRSVSGSDTKTGSVTGDDFTEDTTF